LDATKENKDLQVSNQGKGVHIGAEKPPDGDVGDSSPLVNPFWVRKTVIGHFEPAFCILTGKREKRSCVYSHRKREIGFGLT
jgi:hypothetical protein